MHLPSSARAPIRHSSLWPPAPPTPSSGVEISPHRGAARRASSAAAISHSARSAEACTLIAVVERERLADKVAVESTKLPQMLISPCRLD